MGSVLERLECRRLLAGNFDLVQALPFALEWSGDSGYIPDRNGVGTGLTIVYPNKLGTEYAPNLLEVDSASSVLKMTTSGSAAAGGNYNSDNTLTNAIGTSIDASHTGFQATVRIRGPLGNIDRPAEQAGLLFGPDQDNYVKIVVAATSTGPAVQFVDEQTLAGRIVHTLPASQTTAAIAALQTVQSIELRLLADPSSGLVFGSYRIGTGGYISMPAPIQLSSAKTAEFFNARSRIGLMAMHKNDLGPLQVAFDRLEIVPTASATLRPTVTATRPGNGQTNVARDAFIGVDVNIPNTGHGIDPSTLNFQTVSLYRTADNQFVSANRNTSGGGDALVLQPNGLLDANTSYTFEIAEGLKDTSGAPFAPFKMTFTTGTQAPVIDPTIAFEKVTQSAAIGRTFTGLTFGPDGKMYAGTLDGAIVRFNVGADGSLSSPQVINTIITANGGPRTITGLAFDPASTASNLLLWVSHGQYVSENSIASDWTGKISRLDGVNLETDRDYVVDLPRSVRDHLTNQLSFGPDGAIYFTQASNTGLGAADNAWGQRPEHLLTAALLRLDPRLITTSALSAKTEDGGHYNPFAPGAPLTIYASGIRNAYDMVWHSNGQLYVPANGGAAGGSTPGFPNTIGGVRTDQSAYTGPAVPALGNVTQTQDDLLFRVNKGGYYGHPNPTRAEYVLNGGNPTSSADKYEVKSYPVGTLPDRNWRSPAYSFGKSYSPNGAIEYKGNAFGGRLKGKLLITRYSGGDDVIALTLKADGSVGGAQTGIAGLSLFRDPVDIAQHPDADKGFLYVAEFGGQRITLLRPVQPGAKLLVDAPNELLFSDAPGGASGARHTITLKNTGSSPLILQADAVSVMGANAPEFLIVERPPLPRTLSPGEQVRIVVAMAANSGVAGTIKTATLRLKTNDPSNPITNIPLRGLVTAGAGGENEPSLQRIFDFYKLPINVGDSNKNDVYLDTPPRTPNDEIVMPRFVRASSAPVTIEPLAVFGVSSNPAVRFGYYDPGSPTRKTELFTVATSAAQAIQPDVQGATAFETSLPFSLYTVWPGFGQREVYGEDALNTWEPNAANRRKMRVYPLKDSGGAVVADAYIVAFEEFTAGYDYQDFVAIIRNVKASSPAAAPELGVDNLDGAPYTGRLAFNKVQNPNNSRSGKPTNVFHDVARIRLRNTGGSPLAISRFQIEGPWELVGAPSTANIAPGGTLDLSVRFTATSGRVHQGALGISSNDPNQPNTVIQLAGYWQNVSESNQEPSLAEMMKVLGYDTKVTFPGQNLAGGGLRAEVGEEILSGYWSRADSTLPVGVRQLAAWHTQGDVPTLRWHAKGSTALTSLIAANGAEGQSFLPNATSGGPASASFSPTGLFGFRIDGEWSDDAKNVQERPGGNYGHHVRFYRVRDLWGEPVANTFIMTMDYQGINYDYNDNVYLVSNVRPEVKPASPIDIAAYGGSNGIHLDWADNVETNITGYLVYRFSAPNSTDVVRLTSNPISLSEFIDTSAPAGTTSYYRVTAVFKNGSESTPSAAHAVRPVASKAAPPITGSATAAPRSAASMRTQSVLPVYTRDFSRHAVTGSAFIKKPGATSSKLLEGERFLQ